MQSQALMGLQEVSMRVTVVVTNYSNRTLPASIKHGEQQNHPLIIFGAPHAEVFELE